MSAAAERGAPGAPAAAGFVPLCVPEIGGREWDYTKSCLDTGWVSSVGRFVDRFEEEVAAKVGVRSAVATTNGTAALHTALIACGVLPDDEVLVSSLTFIAPVNAIRYTGAWPVFIDAEPDYWQMSPDGVRAFLARNCSSRNGSLYNKNTGRRISAILPVDILGHPADMQQVVDIARNYGLKVIEDATEALGAKYKGLSVGSAADVACFSFNGNKIITTGGGGMIVTDNESVANRCKYLTTQAKDDPIEYEHGEIGFNYRLTNVLAAIGCAQLEQLDAFVARKQAIASRYNEALRSIPGITPMGQAPWATSTFWLYTVLIDPDLFGMDSRLLIKALDRQKVQSRPLWQPIHLSKAHRVGDPPHLPVAEHLNARAISLPCSVGLTSVDQQRVIASIRTIHMQTR